MPNILPTLDVAILVNCSCSVMCLVAQLCLTLCHPMDHSLSGSFVHGGSPGKNTGVGSHVLPQGSSQPKDQTQVSHIAGRLFTIWATREALSYSNGYEIETLCHLNSPFPNNQWCCISFPVPICHCTFSVKCPNLLPILCVWGAGRALFKNSLYILDTSPVSDILCENIFSQLALLVGFSHCCFWGFFVCFLFLAYFFAFSFSYHCFLKSRSFSFNPVQFVNILLYGLCI